MTCPETGSLSIATGPFVSAAAKSWVTEEDEAVETSILPMIVIEGPMGVSDVGAGPDVIPAEV